MEGKSLVCMRKFKNGYLNFRAVDLVKIEQSEIGGRGLDGKNGQAGPTMRDEFGQDASEHTGSSYGHDNFKAKIGNTGTEANGTECSLTHREKVTWKTTVDSSRMSPREAGTAYELNKQTNR
jgi:hypothetical protein